MVKQIETERLILRTPKLSDSVEIQEYFNNWEIIKWLRPQVPWPYTKDSSYKHIKEMLTKKNVFLFSILLKSSQKVIGTIRFKISNDNNSIYAERGFALSQEHWGQGYMNEASLAATDFIFSNTEVQEIIGYNALENESSRKIKIRQGFELQGTQIADPPYHGGYDTEEIWILTKDKYLALKKKI